MSSSGPSAPRRPRPIPALEAQAKAEIHALGVLTGQTPGRTRRPSWRRRRRACPLPPVIPAGLPSDLLRRRPDIRAAERELAAATADIGVAVADLYPRFSLTAAPALVSTALGSLLEWGSRSFSAGAALDWPIFDGGRRRANIEVRNARQEQAMIAYRKAVLTGAPGRRGCARPGSTATGDSLPDLEQALGTALRAEEIARTRYRGGLVTLSDVLHGAGTPPFAGGTSDRNPGRTGARHGGAGEGARRRLAGGLRQ